MLSRVPTTISNVLSYFGFYRIADRMGMHPAFVFVSFYRVSETEWFPTGGSDDFVSYKFPTATVKGFAVEKI